MFPKDVKRRYFGFGRTTRAWAIEIIEGMAGKTTTESANHLRAWREKAGLTQSKLAEMAETASSVISELESGTTGLSPKWLRRLAPHLGTTPGRLLEHSPDDFDDDVFAAMQAVPEDRLREAVQLLRILGAPKRS